MSDRIALVIGNASYTHATKLVAPLEDAAAIIGVLEGLDFTVIPGFDCDFDAQRSHLEDFMGRLDTETTALFYFSGHGAQTPERSNFVLAVDARINRTEDLGRFGHAIDDILAKMRARAKISLLFLDACRDDPFTTATPELRTKRIIAERPGLASVPNERLGQALIAHAAEEGRTAIDPSKGLSPFTRALCDHLATPGRDIREVLTLVRRDVEARTDKRQRPWTSESLVDKVVLAATGESEPALPPKPVRDPESEPVPRRATDQPTIVDSAHTVHRDTVPRESRLTVARLAEVRPGPIMNIAEVPRPLIDAFAEALNDLEKARELVLRASRIVADNNPEGFTRRQCQIGLGDMPVFSNAYQFWFNIFSIAGSKSRRLVAALLLAEGAPDPRMMTEEQEGAFDELLRRLT